MSLIARCIRQLALPYTFWIHHVHRPRLSPWEMELYAFWSGRSDKQ